MIKMDNIIIMSFTEKGLALAGRIAGLLRESGLNAEASRVHHLWEFVPDVFKKGNILVFVGAVGIAVRAVSGLLKGKTEDPAVIVVDELGRYVIPILSGHIGGANAFANMLAGLIDAVPIITTATDINYVFAVDTYARENRYAIENPENIKDVSAALLSGREVGLFTSYEIAGKLPENIVFKNTGEIGIYIGLEKKQPFEKTLRLMPKCFHAGVGTRKGIPFKALREFFFEILSDTSIDLSCVATISSIDLKKGEPAIRELADELGIDFITYPAELLKKHEGLFTQSDFVKETTGVGNICETSAYLSSKNGEIVVPKRVKNGITMSFARETWVLKFRNLGT